MCQQHVLGEATRLVTEGIQIFGSHTTVLILPATGVRQRECLAIRWSPATAIGDRIHRLTVFIRHVDDHPAALDEGLSVAIRGLAEYRLGCAELRTGPGCQGNRPDLDGHTIW